MAKFLPFIVEKSTPIYIYQTLISRSKGLNNLLVTSIFFLVLSKGITAVRKTAEELPDQPTDKLYENLIAKYEDCRVSNKFYQRIQSIRHLFKKHAYESLSEELKDFEIADIMSFLLVICLHVGNAKEFTLLTVEDLFKDKTKEIENNIKKYKLFSNTGSVKNFTSKNDLAAYVHFFTLVFTQEKPLPVKAILITDTKSKFDKQGN